MPIALRSAKNQAAMTIDDSRDGCTGGGVGGGGAKTLVRKALIVDDDVAIRLLLSRILRRSCFAVDVARDGAEAIEKLAAEDYSIILLDLMMPRIDGVAVVRYLDHYRPELLKKIIVLTAWGAAAYEKVCPPVGRFLEKPFNVDDLMREITECCWMAD